MEDASLTAGYPLYKKVAENAGTTITYSFIALGGIWFLMRVWPLGAKILFWISLVLNGLNAIQVVVMTVVGVVAFLGGKRESKWMWAANAARIVEISLSGLAVWWSARLVGYA